MIRRCLLSLVALVWLLPLGGCQLKDIDKRFFVVTTGFDFSGDPVNPYRVTLRLALPSSKAEEGGAMSLVQHMDAPSIAEAVRHLKSSLDKELEFGHCREFVFGLELIKKKGFNEAMQWLARRRDIQSISNMMIGDPDASSVVTLQPKSERYPGNSLFLSFGNEGTEASHTVTTYLFDLYRREYETGLDPVIPVVRVTEGTYHIDRVGLLDKDKLRLILNTDETQVYNMTSNDIGKSVVGLPADNGRIVLAVTKIRSRMHITKGRVPQAELRIRIEGFLEQSPIRALEKDWHGLERRMADHFSDTTEQLLYKIRDQGVDPYGFGLHYMADNWGTLASWKEWKKIYPDVRFKVKTDIKIYGTGLIR